MAQAARGDRSRGGGLWQGIRRDKVLLLLLAPVLLYYIVFHYMPMAFTVISFQNYSPTKGILGSDWVGLKWFSSFFSSPFFGKLLGNTVILSLYTLLVGFPFPIVFALMLNEMRVGPYKKIIQTVSYFPYFISLVVAIGILNTLFSPINGLVNNLIAALGGQKQMFMTDARWFRTMYVGSNVWQNFGFTAIIYLSSLSAIDPQIYESSKLDGATRWQNMFHITIPSIMPIIITMLILRMGNIMSIGFEKVYLMYQPSNASVSDVISLYVYRKGIKNMEYSFSTAVGLFNSVVNFAMVFLANTISNRVNGSGIW